MMIFFISLLTIPWAWWPLVLEFPDFLELFLDFFVLIKPLKRVVLDTMPLKFSWFFFLFCCGFFIFMFFYTNAKCFNFKPFAWFKHCRSTMHMQKHIIFTKQCKQNSIVHYDTLSSFRVSNNQAWYSQGM